MLHAVKGQTVDVYVNGERTLNNFKPGSLAGPLNLAGGSYEVAITADDAEDDSDPLIGPIDLELEDGRHYTAVAHLEEGGDPTATLFRNDTSKTEAGQGRLTVRHVAAAPAVDVLAGGDAVISDLSNPDEEVLDLDAGTVEASVAAAGTTDPVIGPADVNVKEGANTIVYAWGSLDDDNLDIAVQTISGPGLGDGHRRSRRARRRRGRSGGGRGGRGGCAGGRSGRDDRRGRPTRAARERQEGEHSQRCRVLLHRPSSCRVEGGYQRPLRAGEIRRASTTRAASSARPAASSGARLCSAARPPDRRSPHQDRSAGRRWSAPRCRGCRHRGCPTRRRSCSRPP